MKLIILSIISVAVGFQPNNLFLSQQKNFLIRSKALLSSEEEISTKTKTFAPVFTDVCQETGITLSRFMIELTMANPHLSELESIFSSIQTAGKTISNLVRRSTLTGNTGYLDEASINVQGEEQKKIGCNN